VRALPFYSQAIEIRRFRRFCQTVGSVYRTLVPLWQRYFHPPFDDRRTGWDQGRQTNKLVSAPAPEDTHAYRHSRIAK
jgi:hypothetical protein